MTYSGIIDINRYGRRTALRQRKYTRIMAMIISISMIAGIAAGIFMAWPLLLPFLLAAVAAAYFYIRYRRKRR